MNSDNIRRWAEEGEVKRRVWAVQKTIADERNFQDEKWGPITGKGGHSLPEWYLLAKAEMEEVERAIIKGGSDRNSVRSEMIQVMAVLHAALEQHGVENDHDGRHI